MFLICSEFHRRFLTMAERENVALVSKNRAQHDWSDTKLLTQQTTRMLMTSTMQTQRLEK
jgi:hypothetical protein